jgi:uncharacterized damage-inducible protein DinB
MNTTRRLLSAVVIALLLGLCGAVAQEKAAAPKGVQGAFLKQSKFVEGQFVKLANAVPQEKYNWRPGEGVRSIAEAFLHVAEGNYVTLTTMGGKVPEGVNPQTLEKSTTNKAEIVAAMQKSFKAVDDFVVSVPNKDFDRVVDFFGNKMSVLDMIFLAATHQHETLGQAIAYARMNNVVPPWTAERQEQMKQQEKKN